MLILDTCVLVFDALDPNRLSKSAVAAIAQAEESGTLACCDISLWEIAMLVSKGRLDPGTDARTFIKLALEARQIEVLPISAEIAAQSATPDFCAHGDPADRLIASTAIFHKAQLVTPDRKLSKIAVLNVIW